MVFVRLCVYVRACMCLLIDVTGLFCVCCSVSFLSCFVFGVYVVFVVCRVAVCCFIGLVWFVVVSRSCLFLC